MEYNIRDQYHVMQCDISRRYLIYALLALYHIRAQNPKRNVMFQYKKFARQSCSKHCKHVFKMRHGSNHRHHDLHTEFYKKKSANWFRSCKVLNTLHTS
jgi:hypothetical protein